MLNPALQAQSSSAILRNVLKEVLASTVYAASVAMANGWRSRKYLSDYATQRLTMLRNECCVGYWKAGPK